MAGDGAREEAQQWNASQMASFALGLRRNYLTDVWAITSDERLAIHMPCRGRVSRDGKKMPNCL